MGVRCILRKLARLSDEEKVLAIFADDVPLPQRRLLEGEAGGKAGKDKVS
jgi:hypothetical protein